VKLQFSQDGGYSWDYFRHACYQSGRFIPLDDTIAHTADDVSSHLCTGSARELREGSRYHVGDFDQWNTIIIPVSEALVGKYVVDTSQKIIFLFFLLHFYLDLFVQISHSETIVFHVFYTLRVFYTKTK